MRFAVSMYAMLLFVCAHQGSADELSVSSDGARPTACQRTTAGVEEVTPSEPTGVGAGIVLDGALGFIDEKTYPTSRFAAPGWQLGHAFALVLIVFTPRNLTAHEVLTGDRPYASLFFPSAGRRYVSSDSDVAYNSSLTVGMMSLPAAGSVQHALHSLVTGSVGTVTEVSLAFNLLPSGVSPP
jgi:hypothetical protein